MTGTDRDPYRWIEWVVKACQAVGLNPVRTRWKLRKWQDRLHANVASLSTEKEALTRRHKTCPSCRTFNDARARVCASCGARLHGRATEIVGRLVRRFDIGMSPETFLALAFFIAYVVSVVYSGGLSLFSIRAVDLVYLGGNYPGMTLGGQWWRLWTAVLLHAGIWHIGFNTYALLYIMPMVRHIFGPNKAMFVFVVTGVFASFTSLVWALFGGAAGVSIGASGAISGLIGLTLAWGHRDGTPSGIAIRNAMARWVIYIVLFGLVMGADNAAHIGGVVSGAALSLVMPTNLNRPDTPTWRTLGALAWLAVIAGTALIVFLGVRQPGMRP